MNKFYKSRVNYPLFLLLLLCFGLAKEVKGQGAAVAFSSVPITTAKVGVPYRYPLVAAGGNGVISFTGTALPSWLKVETMAISVFASNIAAPSAIAEDAIGNIYVTERSGTNIYKVAPDGSKVIFTNKSIEDVYGMVIKGSNIYLSYVSRGVTRIDMEHLEQGEVTIFSGNGSAGLALKGDDLYVALYSDGKIIKINPEITNQSYTSAMDFVTDINVPWGLSFDKAGHLIYTELGTRSVLRFDGTVKTTLLESLPEDPSSAILGQDDHIFVSFNVGSGVKRYAAGSNVGTVVFFSQEASSVSAMYMASSGSIVFSAVDLATVYKLNFSSSLGGTPAYGDIGLSSIALTATDGATTDGQNFGITVAEPDPLVVTATNPYNHAIGVTQKQDISLRFSESIKKGTGNITIRKKADNSIAEVIPVTAANVLITGKTVTINPVADLGFEVNYYITIEPATFKSIWDTPYAGISDAAGLTFSTLAYLPIVFTSRPATTAVVGVPYQYNLVVTGGFGDFEFRESTIPKWLTLNPGTATAFGEPVANTSAIAADAEGNIYIADSDTKIYKISADGDRTEAASKLSGPVSYMAIKENYIYLSYIYGGLMRVNLEHPREESVIISSATTAGIAFKGNDLYAALPNESKIVRINLADPTQVTDYVTNVVYPLGIAFNKSGELIFVEQGNSNVSKFDGVKRKTLLTRPNVGLSNISVDQYDNLYFKASNSEGIYSVEKFSPETNLSMRIYASRDGYLLGTAMNKSSFFVLEGYTWQVFRFKLFDGLTGTPRYNDAGTNAVNLNVTDGITNQNQQFEITIAKPALVTLTGTLPEHNAADVAAMQDISLSFSEKIVKGTGNIVIRKVSDDTVVETIPVSGANVYTADKTLFVNPDNNLAFNTSYYVMLDATAVTTVWGTPFAGITSKETFAFKTTLYVPPLYTSTPITVASVDVPYKYTIDARDGNNGRSSFSVTTLPSWLTLKDGEAVAFGSTIGNPTAIVTDEHGDSYVFGDGKNIYKITADGNTSVFFTRPFTRVINALAIHGDYLYLSEEQGEGVYRISLPHPESGQTQVLNYYRAYGLAFRDNDLYVSLEDRGKVIKLDPDLANQEYAASMDYLSGLQSPTVISFNTKGELYIVEVSNNRISRFDGKRMFTVLTDNEHSFQDLKLDKQDNLYISIAYSKLILKYNEASALKESILASQEDVSGLGISSSGALIYGVPSLNQVFKVPVGRLLTGIPRLKDIGDHKVVINLSDGLTNIPQEFDIAVSNPNLPTLTSLTPVNLAKHAGLTEDIVLSFDQPVVAGAGNIVISDANGLVETIPVGSTGVTIAGNIVTINPQANFVVDGHYGVVVEPGAFKDVSGRLFPGILTGAYQFSAGINLPPVFSSVAATSIPVGQPYSYAVAATDENGDELRYSAPTLPTWLKWKAETPVTRNTNLDNPEWLTSDGTGHIYAANYQGVIYNITVPGVTEVLTTVNGGVSAMVSKGQYLYVINYGNILRIDVNNPSGVADVIFTADNMGGMVFKGDYLYVALSSANRVIRINPSVLNQTYSAAMDYMAGASPGLLAFNKSGDLYVVDKENGNIWKFDGRVLTKLPGLTGFQSQIAIDAEDNVYFYGNAGIIKYAAESSTPESVYENNNYYKGLVATSSGSLLASEYYSNQIVEIKPNGILYGTPDQGDVGIHAIAIDVTDGSAVVKQEFTIEVLDETPPEIKLLNPKNGSVTASVQQNIVLTFTEKVVAGSGKIIIKDDADHLVETITVPSLQVRFSGNTVTIDPAANFAPQKKYFVSVETTVLKDAYNNVLAAGLLSQGDYQFTTAVNSAPLFVSNPVITATENVPYSYILAASDVNDDLLTFAASKLPSWLTMKTGKAGFTDFGSPIAAPRGMAQDAAGNIYVGQRYGNKIYKINPDGKTTEFATRGDGEMAALAIYGRYLYISYTSGGTPAARTVYRGGITRINLENPIEEQNVFSGFGSFGMAFHDGDLYFAVPDQNKVFKINPEKLDQYYDQPIPVISTTMPVGVAFNKVGDLFVSGIDGSISRFTEQSLISRITGLEGSLSLLMIDPSDNVYVGTQDGGKIYKVLSGSEVATVVSTGGLNATVWGMATTASGTLLVADQETNAVYKIESGAVLSGTAPHDDQKVFPVSIDVSDGLATANQSFNITVADPNPPILTTLSPLNNAVGVTLKQELVLTFNETVAAGTGVVLVKSSAGNIELSVDIASAVIAGNTVTIKTTSGLPANANLYINVASGVIKDLSGNNYAGISNQTDFTFKTTKAESAITLAATATATYGDADIAPVMTSTNVSGPVVLESSDPLVATIEAGKVHILKAGVVTITARQAEDELFFAAAPKQQILTIGRLPLIVTPLATTKIYGSSDPVLAYTLSAALKGSDRLTGALARTAGIAVNTYDITLGDLGNVNYVLTLAAAKMAITPKPITVAATSGLTKAYGDADPVFSYALAAGSTLESGDVFSGTIGRSAGEESGTYGYTIGNLSAGANYSITLAAGTFTISPKAVIVVTAIAKSKVYGAADPVFTYTSEPSLASITGSLSREAGENAGSYTIGQGTLSVGGNYVLVFKSAAKMTITPKPITVAATSGLTKAYGAADPVFSYALAAGSTLESGDVFSGTIGRSAGEEPGSYGYTIDNLSAGANYSITLAAGNFTITPKAVIVVTAIAKSKVYGAADPVFTYTSEPSLASITGSLSREAGENAGSYAIGQGTLSVGGNYVLVFKSAVLQIEKRALVITAENKTKVAGSVNPELTATFAGFVNSETKAVLTTQPVLSTTAITSSAAGNYAITATGAAAGNYNISYVNGVMTVNPDVIIVTPVVVNMAPTLAAIANQIICYTANAQAVALSDISAGEATQTVALTVSSNNAGLFDALSVARGNGNAGTLTYRLKAGAAGAATVTVTVRDNGGTDNGGVDVTTRSFTITVNAIPIVAISSDKGLSISKGDRVVLTATGGVSYSWRNAAGIVSGQNTAVLTVRPDVTATYEVTATNAGGCAEVQTITIEVVSDYIAVKATNLMTPNGDGKNDFFVIDNIDKYPGNVLKVFDRGGRVLFEKKDYDNSFDATIKGSPLKEGTYYYIIDFGPGQLKKKGFITVVRDN
ncbi:MBG domain-containing protein [Pedobacter duraquae]|uniref:Gliding motility-associated-like protein n=1 Tax=Pedobacter duraquae TaxID=425511 RepID=A0A4R6IA40_9SPHI|nr:MBG domain-containing protein [Pedobacter duraquae]TDO19063.1 gliding motility-associated-like protein [Pedobacter duraquae]